MALTAEIYQAFEDVVGQRNISQDKGVLESYRCITSQSSAHYGPFDHKTPLPQAVIMPGSTEEVQKIIKLCNKYKIQFKASTTFWSAMGFIGSENAIQLDMRRMKGIEIDEKNMIAVVEPYAIGAVVQVEAMKVGLNCNIPGVGCSSSVVASTAGWVGFGPTSISMGVAGENMLGAEWVLPDGEVLRTGSLGAGAGWFNGEGPGPSTRSVLRGFQGTTGTMGVCTKVAIRLHPWPGPTCIPTRGQTPAYKASLPDNFKCYTLCYPSWEAWAKGAAMLHEAEIVYLGHRQFNMFGRDIKAAMLRILNDPNGQLADLEPLLQDPELKKQNELMKMDIQVVLAGMTARDIAYKEKVLDRILELCGGWKSEMMLEKDMQDYVLLYLLRLGHKNLNYTLCGSYEGNYGLSSNVFVATAVIEEASELKDKWAKTHTTIADTGGDSDMGSLSIIGGGGAMGWEFFVNFDAYDKASIQGTNDFIDETQKWMTSKGLGVDMGRWNQDIRRKDGLNFTQEEHDAMYVNAAQPLVFAYQWKVREAVNPNHLGGSYYRTLTPSKIGLA
ncbi:FAD-binding oxidoreductase [Holophaga foetida]|uniref:FAD-binding oxidoreductase n=1 Tax=Holophaga foetida TaxID=35839 RepID=UPI0002471CFF|nr:FAD-binding oxidoreductase [Holophaga foetida]